MGPSSSDIPDYPVPAEPPSSERFEPHAPDRFYVPPVPMERPQEEPIVRYVVLFLLTVATTTIAGAIHHGGFRFDTRGATPDFLSVAFYLPGLWYSVPILAILGAHEFGHYLACRYYRVAASLPYFLPAPPILLTGTLGAFIRIRQPIPGKRALFDIGIAGPIAGFIVAIPVLFMGISLSQVVPVPLDAPRGLELGEPLLFKAISWLVWGNVPDSMILNAHPMAFAAWFGLLATALNLFPIGQLDGGHISYAVLGRKSTFVTLATLVCLIALTFVSNSWIVWTVVTLAMLLTFGPRHPRTVDEEVPLDRTRLWLAAFAVVMFVLCFTPAPIEQLDLVR